MRIDRWNLLPLLLVILTLLVACGGTPSTTTTTVETGHFQEYALPHEKSGLMRPVVDRQGRVWFGEMDHNALGMFDPKTRQFQEITPPNGQSGIMGIAVAADGGIWFAEQLANYIGYYQPDTQRFQTYSLPTLTTPDPSNANAALTLPSAPNDLSLDAQGDVWFTEMNADAVGMLDVKTGEIKQYPLSSQKSVQKVSPYGITVDAQGIVWFTENSTNRLGRLDPTTGAMHFFSVQGVSGPLMELVSGADGQIWGTTFTSENLVRFDTRSETFSAYPVTTSGGSGGMYGLAIAPGGLLWATITQGNELVSMDMSTKQCKYYHIPTADSLPIGIAVGERQTLWFTESGGNKIGALQA